MNLEQIKTFVHIHRLGSFHATAEAMFVPQPTVSHRIRGLENSLGKKLIIRRKGGSLLTAEGAAFLPFAIQVLESLEQGQYAVEDVKEVESSLVLGCTIASSNQIISDVIDTFIQKYPDVKLAVHSLSSGDVIASVKSGKFQLGITRYSTDDEDLKFRMINNENVYLIISAKHPWVSKKSVSLDAITKESLILYPRGKLYRESIEYTFKHMNIPLFVKYEISNIEVIKQLVKKNVGVTMLASSYVNREIQSGELVKVPIVDNPLISRQTFLVYNKGELNNIEKVFFNHLITSLGTQQTRDLKPFIDEP